MPNRQRLPGIYPVGRIAAGFDRSEAHSASLGIFTQPGASPLARHKYGIEKRQRELKKEQKKEEKRQRKLDRKTAQEEAGSGEPNEPGEAADAGREV